MLFFVFFFFFFLFLFLFFVAPFCFPPSSPSSPSVDCRGEAWLRVLPAGYSQNLKGASGWAPTSGARVSFVGLSQRLHVHNGQAGFGQ